MSPVKDTAPIFPAVEVQLSGEDGNAFGIIARVTGALRRAGATKDQLQAFSEEAMSGDYDNVLRTAMKWVQVQ